MEDPPLDELVNGVWCCGLGGAHHWPGGEVLDGDEKVTLIVGTGGNGPVKLM